MRKLSIVLLMAMVWLLGLPVAYADFTLPASLTVIEEEAFTGTAVDSVTVQDEVVSIGDYAFSNIPTLRKVMLPQSVCYIGDHAFWKSEKVTIWGTSGSYPELWAEEHGISFAKAVLLKDDDVSSLDANLIQSWLFCGALLVLPKLTDAQLDFICTKIRIRRRLSELYPVLYDFP